MALKFTVSTVRGRQVRVVIHRTRAAMVRAAERWAGDPTPADTQGCTHGYHVARNPQAVIRLNREDLTRRVIDHEVVHAAQAIYGHDYGELIQAHPLTPWTHFNETFAHTVTELQVLIYTALRAHDLRPPAGF